MRYDYCVVGGGIVGLATAMAILRRRPGAGLVLVEKEDRLGAHQTSHNSGVIHAGIYYAPGSLKARLCREGNRATREFCDTWGIRYENCGKLIVATDHAELSRLEELSSRAKANGIEVNRISRQELVEMEPNVVGTGALLVPSTGIVDYSAIGTAISKQLTSEGGEIRTGTQVIGFEKLPSKVRVRSDGAHWDATRVVVCAGLQADRLAQLAGVHVEFHIVPFRGEYYVLPPSRQGMVRHLIYPVPDPSVPFLGIHLTLMIDGRITVGPNAVLGLGRERYARGSVALRDIGDYLGFPGFWRLLGKNWRSGISQIHRSISRSKYLADYRKYCPSLTSADLLPYPAGIRAQAVSGKGTLVHDFLFAETERMLHVCNAPSPAATSALPIGEFIAAKLLGEGTIASKHN
jgi:(S)-2-hydroxyglutarate dehydrogenase